MDALAVDATVRAQTACVIVAASDDSESVFFDKRRLSVVIIPPAHGNSIRFQSTRVRPAAGNGEE